MKFLTISGLVLISAAAASSANAAVTVLGGGLGATCYQVAEFGGDPAQGIQTCTMAIEQEALNSSDKAATYINRGILRSRVGDTNGALRDYNWGLTMDGQHGEGYVDRGATYIEMQRYREALDDINRGIEMGANKPHIAYYDRAIADEALGNIRAAYMDYKKAVEIEPNFPLATEQLSRFKVVRKESSGQ
jgi:tetratricopeptide (TPR) repeat protein